MPEEQERQANIFNSLTLLRQLLDAIPTLVLIQYQKWQAVFVNQSLLDNRSVNECRITQ